MITHARVLKHRNYAVSKDKRPKRLTRLSGDEHDNLPGREKKAPRLDRNCETRTDYRLIRRFLTGMVGRPWAEVHARIHSEFPAASQADIIDDVIQNVVSIDGKFAYAPSRFYRWADHDKSGLVILTGNPTENGKFFVHPKTKVLTQNPTTAYPTRPPEEITFSVDKKRNLIFKKIEGIWFQWNLVPDDELQERVDEFNKSLAKTFVGLKSHLEARKLSLKRGCREDAIRSLKLNYVKASEYSYGFAGTNQKTMNKQELKKAGLKNAPQ